VIVGRIGGGVPALEGLRLTCFFVAAVVVGFCNNKPTKD